MNLFQTDKELKVYPDTQDRNSIAWHKLIKLIEIASNDEREVFDPAIELGDELWSQITILPKSISTLKKIKTLKLYGSNLKRIPPEIGEMESLENFIPYTSYSLHWFPFEITRCKNLVDSTISTRALYGNYKYRPPFPNLEDNPVQYYDSELKCSICNRKIDSNKYNQVWVSLKVATDVIPLLTNVCSNNCYSKIPKPPEDYVQTPHKGGLNLKQPPDYIWTINQRFKEKKIKNNLSFIMRLKGWIKKIVK